MRYCKVCQAINNIECHHIIFRSQSRALINCKLNQVDLCNYHHNFLHHDKNGYKLNRQLKLEMQNKLEFLLDKQYFTREELKDIFKINENGINSFTKLLKSEKGMFYREDILRVALGGKLIVEGEAND